MNRARNVTRLAIAVLLLGLALPAAAQVDDWKDIKYPELPDFEIPEPEVFTLKNGMKVFLMEDHELPLIEATAYVRGGALTEPAELTGLGDVLGQALREGGTKSMTGDEIDEFLAARAAHIETGMGGNLASASLDVLAEDFDEVFPVFVDILRNPSFAQDKIDLARVQLETSIARRNDDVGGIVGREFAKLIYGADSPLARVPEYATVQEIDREDLVAWHRKHFHPNNVMLGLVGDFDSKKMKEKVQKAFGDWAAGPKLDQPEVAYNKKVTPGVYFVDKQDVTQANVRLGHLGTVTEATPDWYALQVMNEVLGGGFAARLFSNVRSQKGLAYSVFGGVGSSFLRPGIFQVGLSTKAQTMAAAVDALKEEVRGIIERPPSEEELRRAKEAILNSFVFRYDSPGEVLAQQMTYDFYGLPADFLETYRQRIEAVTREDVTRVAKKYVHPDEMVLLVVGPPGSFDRPVDTFGKAMEVDITIPAPPSDEVAVERSEGAMTEGREVLDRLADEVGGEAELRSAESQQTILLEMQGQQISLGQTVAFELPDRMRQAMRTPMGEQVVVLSGDDGFVKAGPNVQDLPQDKVAEELESLWRDPLVLISRHDDPGLDVVATGTETIGGVSCDMVVVTYRDVQSRLCVDGEGRLVARRYSDEHPMLGKPGTFEVRYDDWRQVEGWLVPFKQEITFDGEKFASVTVQEMRINPDLAAGLFDRPAAN